MSNTSNRAGSTAGLAAVMVAAGWFAQGLGPSGATANPDTIVHYGDAYKVGMGRPYIPIGVTYRDFTPAASGGHADFGITASGGPGRYVDIFADALGEDRRPIFRSSGHLVGSDWTNAAAENIVPTKSYLAVKGGDSAGSSDSGSGGAVMSASSTDQWYRTTPGVNSAKIGMVAFDQQGDGTYLIDESLDTFNASPDYDYTAELGFVFVNEQYKNWYITTETDTEVWVYVDGQLVIDGGLAPATAGGHVVGIACDGAMTFNSNSSVTVAAGTFATVATNSTGGGMINLTSSEINGDVMVGPGGNPNSVIDMNGGSTITGSTGTLSSEFEMPTITLPSGFGSNQGDRKITGNSTLSNTMVRYKSLEVDNSGRLTIDGDVKIRCEKFILNSGGELRMNAGASLEIYVDDQFLINSGGQLNDNTKDPSLVTVYVLGSSDPEINSDSGCYMNIAVPNAMLKINSDSSMAGNFIGKAIELNSGSEFLVMDTGPWGGALFGSSGSVPAMRQTIELNRLEWLQDRRPYAVKMFFANRSGDPSNLRVETNISTLNSINLPIMVRSD